MERERDRERERERLLMEFRHYKLFRELLVYSALHSVIME
jgi:hypothetical protein